MASKLKAVDTTRKTIFHHLPNLFGPRTKQHNLGMVILEVRTKALSSEGSIPPGGGSM